LYNGVIHTQAASLTVDSMAINRKRIVAIGKNLQHDPDFKAYDRIDLKGKCVVPGLVDAHTHFVFMARSLGTVRLQALPTLEACLKEIASFAKKAKAGEWVVGEGYAPDRFKTNIEPTAAMLDAVTGSHPTFIYSKDQHSCWVNSAALALAGITKKLRDPEGGEIVRDHDGRPTGILREGPAISLVYKKIPPVSNSRMDRLYRQALDQVYRRGVTGVHSFDGPEAYRYLERLASRGKVGLRFNYYPSAALLDELTERRVYFGSGDEFFRIAGVKIFSDGSLGSKTALCFDRYIGSKDNFGIEVTSVAEMKRLVRRAQKLNLPAAIHAIGDKAVSNVLDAFSDSGPLSFGARHRIEHLQLIRRPDIDRLLKLKVTASMQPSHCPSDIDLVRTYWGKRGVNAYIFRTLLERGVPLAFGSDAPIEPLDPIAGIHDAVRRARPGKRDVFYPEERITAAQALFGFTAGPAYAAGQEHCRGYLLPGYPADLVVLDRDILKTPPTRILDTTVLATILDGAVTYSARRFSL
jgi:hypothetical protein